MSVSAKVKVHIKNNHWDADSFPNTPEGEEVFTITQERYQDAAANYRDTADRLEVFIDWDTDNFEKLMKTAEVLCTWNLPTENLAAVAPALRWIHIIGAGVEHLLPMDWLPVNVVMTNNKGVHAAKAGEYGLMALLKLRSLPAFRTGGPEETR